MAICCIYLTLFPHTTDAGTSNPGMASGEPVKDPLTPLLTGATLMSRIGWQAGISKLLQVQLAEQFCPVPVNTHITMANP